MKSNKQIIVSLSLIALAALSGCAKYNPQPLNRYSAAFAPNSTKELEKSVAMAYKVFTPRECKRYLDRNVIAKGYQPIQITITNNSDHSVYVSPKNLSLPTVYAEEVANKVHTNTAARAAGYGVAGLFIWPLLIPAIVDGIGSSEANKELDADFVHKELRDEVLRPNCSTTGLVFVLRRDFQKEFTFAVIEETSSKKVVLNSTNKQETV